MADVDDRRRSVAADDRGQLLLVGALTLAVMLVALAVLLNTAIYTGNVATRDAGPGTGEAIEYEDEATTMARTALGSPAAGEDATYSELRGNFTDTVGGWSRAAATHSAIRLSEATVKTVGQPSQGTEIRQDADRNFTSESETSDWTVANDTTVRAFRLNVSQGSLSTPPEEDLIDLIFGGDDPPEYFQAMFVDDDSDGDGNDEEWRVYFARDADGEDNDDVTVRVRRDGTTIGDACSVPAGDDGHLVVDLTDATVGGEECGAIETMFENLGDGYTLEYVNGENAEGTYSLVADRRIGRLETGADKSADAEPSATRALYSAELRVSYRSADVYYRSAFRVAPGEAGDD